MVPVALSPASLLPGDGDLQFDSEEATPAPSSVRRSGVAKGFPSSVMLDPVVEEISSKSASLDTPRRIGVSNFVKEQCVDDEEKTALERLANFMDSTTAE